MRKKSFVTGFVLATLVLANNAFADDAKASVRFDEATKLVEQGAFPEASRAYAAFAKEFPTDARAPKAFADAVKLNSQLDRVDLNGAEFDLQHFENTFVPMNLDIWAEMTLVLIDGFITRDDRRSALALLHRMVTIRDQLANEARKKKTSDLQTLREIDLRARGRLARTYSELGDHHGADAEYGRMQKLIAELGVWPGKKPAKNNARYPETLDIIAETFFYFAEEKRFDAERQHLPAYVGNGDRDSVLKFINGPGSRWYENREFAVKEAHRLYAIALGIELPKPIPPKPPPPPESGMIGLVGGDPNAPIAPWGFDSADDQEPPIPSPKWAIAAAERVGFLWSNFVKEQLAMPIPKPWRPTGLIPGTDLTYEELRTTYIDSLDSPGETLKQQSKNAYRLCINLSIKHAIVDEHSRACIAWLSKNYGAEYHEIDDFAPPGEFFALGRFTRPAPLPKFTH